MVPSDITRLRLQNQSIAGSTFKKPDKVVAWLGAVQAQDYAGAKWAVGQRTNDCVETDVEQAYGGGAILRTHVLRPTWHFVTPADIRWMQELTAPRVRAILAYYDRKLELDGAVFTRTRAVLQRALRGGKHRTRVELAQDLDAAGIVASGQRLGRLLMHAELDALICSGVMRGKQHTYALVAERAPQAKSLQRDEALAELTLRYFKGHGPATVQDFMWWSGLTGKEAKAGLEIAKSDLVREVLDGTVYWMGRGVGPAGNGAASCHLLPAYDEYLVAYRDRSAAIHPARLQEVMSGDRDMLTATFVFNGYVAGVWRRTLERNAVHITPHPFLKLTSTEKRKLSDAAQRYGRFLGKRVVLS